VSEAVLKRIDDKLSTLIRLESLDIVKGRPFMEQIELLSNAGLTPAEIAMVLGKTPNNIRVQLHYIRKKKGGRQEEALE
jgi:hypothetical protein